MFFYMKFIKFFFQFFFSNNVLFDILNGKTPLHFAAMQSNPRSLELLLALEGIEVNIEDMIFFVFI